MDDKIEERRDFLNSKAGQDELFEILTNVDNETYLDLMKALQNALSDKNRVGKLLSLIHSVIEEHCMYYVQDFYDRNGM